MAITENPNPLFSMDGDTPRYVDRIAQPQIYDAESQLIRGTMSFSYDKLRELDPSYTGYTQIFVLRMPQFMTAVANGKLVKDYADYYPGAQEEAQRHCKNLKALIELGSTSYSGTPDLTMNTTEVNTGFSERSYPAPTYSAYDGKSFTIRCLETRGEPLRRALEYYINGITDANVKATLLHGATEEDGKTPMEPTLPNYTAAIMIVQTDQTLRNIQDISIWNSVLLATSAERSQLDWENGSIDIVQPTDVQMTGVYMPDCRNPEIDKLAMKLLGMRLRLYKRYRDMSADDIGTKYWSTSGGAY
ncbi:hypothetical protein [uncultured Duncaniella sp.]|uniref:hypothetical protein n=1 Tax=uncultured Duncaniella sp. TaxID=2768039 RepID=UPI002613F6E9|nr:hypothetical protein [uncultured Duncaniella sp.]